MILSDDLHQQRTVYAVFTMTQRLRTWSEPLHLGNKPIGETIGDFWAWGFSDLLSNVIRGSFAEFIVASALKIDMTYPRAVWQTYDLRYGDHKIEVKSSAYIQSWFQKNYSEISFGIAPTREWSAETNQYASEIKRHADVYVFCVLTCKDREKVDPLNMNQWEFYVLHTNILNAHCPDKKTILLSTLEKVQAYKADFSQLAKVVDLALREKETVEYGS